ncbi:hypothetical protein D7S89_21700 [Trinickia fusca]|uniref:Uncharacterized protein n=2 Tax=Trinickia fusca TaxID=2419777 RepID=A0A494XBN9_9BURK|nr:hypothetical protein D7S89_21700 [Trinickia fusca]
MQAIRKEVAMAESVESMVVGLIVLIAAVIIVAAHYRREHYRDRWLRRTDGHRLWDRMRHRH